MKWITSITLNNYRAFKGPYASIVIPENNHLLIYGENGSGKSSIYNAVKDFFHSSENAAKQFDVNLFSVVGGVDEGTIELKIAELDGDKKKVAETAYVFGKPDAQSNHRIPVIRLANKIKGFLDYKNMLQAHSFEVPPNETPNVFNLLVKELLAEHTISNPQGGVGTVELLVEYNRLVEILTKTTSRFEGKGKGELNERLQEIKEALDKLDEEVAKQKDAPEDLNTKKGDLQGEVEEIKNAIKIIDAKFQLSNNLFEELKNLLKKVFTVANEFLAKYFKNKISLDIQLSRLMYDARAGKMQEQLFLTVKYAGGTLPYYHVYLNEARLSAIAICLYLASIKTYSLAASDLHILYLDDVFIGLDTGNRIPLLEILRDEFIRKDDFQLFISTYDRLWFETARHWFAIEKCKMKCLELFIDNDNNPTTPDNPVVIDPSKTTFEKAIKYFEAKDYPASANYLRKTCESELKRILPPNKTLETNHKTGEIQKVDKLETLINHFTNFIASNGINTAPFVHFNTYKKIVFNPLSHDDLEAPHYRREIQNGIALVKNLHKIKSKQILTIEETVAKPLKLALDDNVSASPHNYEFRLLENLSIIQNDTAPLVLSIAGCSVNEVGGAVRTFPSLNAAFDQIWIERGYAAPANYPTFHAKLKVSNARALLNLMSF